MRVYPAQVYRGYWWMACFGGPSPKRHVGWSNDKGFVEMIMDQGGYLSVDERRALGESKLTKKGVSGMGKPTYTGVKKFLKQSQLLVTSTMHSIPACSTLHVSCNAN